MVSGFIPNAPARVGLPNQFRVCGMFQLGAAGVPSNAGASLCAGGITKITRNSAGNFLLTLAQPVPAGLFIMDLNVTIRIAAAVGGKARTWQFQSLSQVGTTTFGIVIQGLSNADAAADPEDNAMLIATLECQLNI